MARNIDARELRDENAKVIEAVMAGETLIITRDGEPVAELRPIRAGRPSFVSPDDIAPLATVGERIDHRQFRADLDSSIDQAP